MKRKTLWGYTRYGAHEIKIYRNTYIKTVLASTICKNEKISIELAASIIDDPTQFTETLLHEFIHAIEMLNVPGALDTTEVNYCSAMVQIVAKGLAQMLVELRQVGIE